ncbi:hypothetical protein D6C98_04373 [Aureobasidium pullulans]|nr:hypothetical protein D6C98_04373 [Aureobasidium pullulans]
MSILPCTTLHRFVFLFCLCLVLVSSSSQCHLPVMMVQPRETLNPSKASPQKNSTAQHSRQRMEKGKHVEKFSHLRHNPNHQT